MRMWTRRARPRGTAGRPISDRVRRSTASQSSSSRSSCSTPRATTRSFGRSSTTIVRRFSPGLKRVGVDAGRDDEVVAGKAFLGRVAHVVGEGDQRVDPPQQLLPLRACRRVPEPVDGGEGRDPERVRVAEGQVGERRQPRVEPVHEVVRALLERLAEVRLHAHGDAELRPARHRHRRAHGEHVGLLAAQQRAPPGQQVGRPGGRRDHRHLVAARPQGTRDACDVVVHVVRLRPRKRRHQADPHRSEG